MYRMTKDTFKKDESSIKKNKLRETQTREANLDADEEPRHRNPAANLDLLLSH